MNIKSNIFSRFTAAFVFLLAVFAIIFFSACNSTANDLCEGSWEPNNAKNASGDEVELAQVYNAVYSNYHGSLTFDKDGTFELWLSPGDPGDGTHTGTYEVTEDDKINALFDEGTQTQFIINRHNDSIESITVYYDEYEVYFEKQD